MVNNNWSCTFRGITRSILLVSIAACTAQSAWTAPAPRPTRANPPPRGNPPTESPAPPFILADDLLAKFPANVSSLPAKGSRITIEGLAMDIRNDDPSKGIWNTRVTLLGKNQGDDNSAHFTCKFDSKRIAPASAVNLGELVRITGTVGDVAPAAGRIELIQCTDVVRLRGWPDPMGFLGEWRGQLPSVPPTPIILKINKDQSVFLGSQGLDHRLVGAWAQVPGAGNETKLSMSLPAADGPVELEWAPERYVMDVPSIPSLFFIQGAHTVGLSKVFDRPPKIDLAAEKQVTQWITVNNKVPQPQQLLDRASKLMFADRDLQTGRTLAIGGGLLKGGKTTELCVVNGIFFAFEYSDAQAKSSGIQGGLLRESELKSPVRQVAPEVKIDSIVLEDKGPLDPAKEIKVKITLHALRLVPYASYHLLMEHVRGAAGVFVQFRPGLDTETVEFVLPPLQGVGPGRAQAKPWSPNPMPVFISVGRSDNGDDSMMRVSEPVGILVDVAP